MVSSYTFVGTQREHQCNWKLGSRCGFQRHTSNFTSSIIGSHKPFEFVFIVLSFLWQFFLRRYADIDIPFSLNVQVRDSVPSRQFFDTIIRIEHDKPFINFVWPFRNINPQGTKYSPYVIESFKVDISFSEHLKIWHQFSFCS